MKKKKLSWFDRMMIGVTFAEANIEEPDLSHLKATDTNERNRFDQEEGFEPFDGETVPVQ